MDDRNSRFMCFGFVCKDTDEAKVYESFSSERLAKDSWKFSYSALDEKVTFEYEKNLKIKVNHNGIHVGWIIWEPTINPLDHVSHL